MDNKMKSQELISALADGQLQGDALVRGLEVAATEPAATEAWHAYHLIGDVLRSNELAGGTSPQVFLARLRDKLQQEQAPPAPLALRPIEVQAVPARLDRPAANDGSQRWKLVAGFASVAAVAAIGWTVLGAGGGRVEGPQLAGVQSVQPVAGGSGSGAETMIRDARLDQLLAAHRQFGGATALQAPAGFLRNATFEGPAR